MSADEGRDIPTLARSALDAFAESAARRRDRDALMDEAFAALFALYRATTRAERRSPAGRDFTATLAELLVGGNNPDRLGLYVVRSQTAAENGRHEGYRPACWRRSMLQILAEEFVPWRDFLRQEDLEAVVRIDDALEAVAETAVSAAGEEVPSWVPESHWWWWEPARKRGEQAPERFDSGPLDAVTE
ncbi:hypothetical protein ACFVWN_13070 [Nocardiopsis flavescens]|uniref:Uncharacterized protein n=1 Tax=Nocardiopsis flavescens TaxID=758803 RepID=A0A1M6W2M4_9ACTN|nr:hypothetical protein [Nocardiopsis flavescens]SHK88000.1 hypothetical protein SAMN05421803_13925 [Nocardiopsis flavescens]